MTNTHAFAVLSPKACHPLSPAPVQHSDTNSLTNVEGCLRHGVVIEHPVSVEVGGGRVVDNDKVLTVR